VRSLLVGLTGGLASGKSTVAGLLAKAGCHVVDADELVAELYAPGQAGAREIAGIAGGDVLTAEGAVDRPALAEKLFADSELRDAVESAIHPLVRQRFEEIADTSQAEIVVLEATLLVEAGYPPDFDLVVSVEAPLAARLARAVERGLTEAQARARLEAQGTGEDRRRGSDIELDNSGSLHDLEGAVGWLMTRLEDRLAALGDTE